MSTAKYKKPMCALCGSEVKGKGYFCSYRCDSKEFEQRQKDGAARFERRQPIKRISHAV